MLASSNLPSLRRLIVFGEPDKLPLNQDPNKCCLASSGKVSNSGIACLICTNLSSILFCSCTSASSLVIVSPACMSGL